MKIVSLYLLPISLGNMSGDFMGNIGKRFQFLRIVRPQILSLLPLVLPLSSFSWACPMADYPCLITIIVTIIGRCAWYYYTIIRCHSYYWVITTLNNIWLSALLETFLKRYTCNERYKTSLFFSVNLFAVWEFVWLQNCQFALLFLLHSFFPILDHRPHLLYVVLCICHKPFLLIL